MNVSIAEFKGELAALGAAGLWAVSTVVYGRLGRSYPPVQLNLMKGAIAIALILLTLLITGKPLLSLDITACGLLLLSGAVGIALGDTAYFAALNCLGARRALLMETLAPPLVAILALIFLGEKLPINAWCGIVLTILGVAWVIAERVPGSTIRQQQLLRGIGFGILAALAQASGAVLSRAALTQAAISPLWAALLRLSAGVVILFPSTLLYQLAVKRWTSPASSPTNDKTEHQGLHLKALPSRRALTAIFFAAFAGTYLAIWLQQTALKYTAAGIAQTLITTSPLFVLPILVALGEVVTIRAVLGVLVAVGGIVLLLGYS
ncbi:MULTISPECIES: DMT family transporter [unclassified Coleofasciculus]|uniref:DMT family transporter n=1 Tax=unclassified Coleofasciculus TaxID=2692782 RepID=UPI00187F8F51|nr:MULTISPECIES: DMT family transporter [unclassified Coleofasciculus]MBE9128924.1 DMT family transporter [Coleofasciculus sp. LEGE 07081]MBE9150392.1 DMT family transporter [Coleofasciculus sp. LEGE 07092]